MNNILEVKFGQKNSITSRNLYQHDYGQKLKFVDLDLPSSYEVHFANQLFGKSITQIGNADGVNIPDILLETADRIIYAWVYLHSTNSDGETVYQVSIPIKKRAKPSTDRPIPVQQDAISEAIAALNYAVSQTTEDVITVQSATDLVEALTTSAAGYVGETLGYRNAAEEYAAAASSVLVVSIANRQRSEEVLADVIALHSGAAAYANTASVYAADAEHTAAQVSGYVTDASNYAAAASQNAVLANNYKLQASTYANDAAAASDSAAYAAAQARNAQVAVENMTVSATTLPTGSPATVQKTTKYGVVNLDFGIPKGDNSNNNNTLNANIIVKQDDTDYLLFPSFGNNDDLYAAAFVGWWPNTEAMRLHTYYYYQLPFSEWIRVRNNSCKFKIRILQGKTEEGWNLTPEDLDENNATAVTDWYDFSADFVDCPAKKHSQAYVLTNVNGYTRYTRVQMGIFNAQDELERTYYTLVLELRRDDDTYTCIRHYDSKQEDNCIYDIFYAKDTIKWTQPQIVYNCDLFNGAYTDSYKGMYCRLPASEINVDTQFRIMALIGTDHYIWSDGVTIPLSYSDLSDKPQIAGVTLTGNKSLADLGIESVPSGGTTGQILIKNSDDDFDTAWASKNIDSPFSSGEGAYSIVHVGNEQYPNIATGDYAFAAGESAIASGNVSFAFGHKVSTNGTSAIAIGGSISGDTGTAASSVGAIAIGQSDKASGPYSIAIGVQNEATNSYSIAIGMHNQSSGGASLAMGVYNDAAGNQSVALGGYNSASGGHAFAAGRSSEAKGRTSTAIGRYTIANGGAQFVCGQANIEDESAINSAHGTGARDQLFIIGNGSYDGTIRSNAMTVDWDGNQVLAGKLTVGAAPTSNMDVATKQYVDSSIPGVPSAYTSIPAALGIASAGSSELWARGDHVHEDNIFWAIYGTTTSAQIEAAYQAGKICAVDYNGQVYVLTVRTSAISHRFMSARSDALPTILVTNNSWANSNRTVPLLTSTTPQPLGTASAGSGTECARSNHVHAMPSAADVGAIAAPSSPSSGQFLQWNGSAWVAASLPVYNGGVS